jgi:hypothetical protein
MTDDLALDAIAEPPASRVRIHDGLIQGSDEWHSARCGLLTASEMKLIVTPTLKPASNDKERSHLFELMAQRITGYVEPSYISDAMLRGHEGEQEAREIYGEHFAPVVEAGFITNDTWGFTIGYSPDGLVGDDGLIEIKTRRQKFHVQTMVERAVPDEFVIQIQTGLIVADRKWCDFISYCDGLPMSPIRVFPDPTIQAAIIDAAAAFERRLQERMDAYAAALTDGRKIIPTERRIAMEIYA